MLGDAVDQVLAQETVTGGEVLWLLQDNLGSVRETVKNDGTVNSRVEYDPFGNMISITDPSNGGAATTLKTRFNFTGQEYDADLKLVWYSDGTGTGRWYDPATGTFINQDALGFAAGDANLYRYVGNGVTYATDPSGLVQKVGIPRIDPNTQPGKYPRIHGPLPGKVPDCWDRGDIERALDEVEVSIRNRTKEQEDKGHEHGQPEQGGHRGRIRDEIDWKNKLIDALRFVAQNPPKPSVWCWSGSLIACGGAASVILIADDATAIGVVDDVLLPFSFGLFGLGCGLRNLGY